MYSSSSSDEGVVIQGKKNKFLIPFDEFYLEEKEEITNVTHVKVLVTGKGGLGKAGATFNTVTAILGGSILTLPYAFAAAGVIPAILATIILGFFAYISLQIIILTYERYLFF